MNGNDIYGLGGAYASGDICEPLIARLKEIAAERINAYRAANDPAALRQMERAGNRDGRLPGPEEEMAMREWMARQDRGEAAGGWPRESGMRGPERPMPPPEERGGMDETHYLPPGSTPLSRLSDRIERMGLVAGGSPEGTRAMLYAENGMPDGRRRRVSYDDPASYLFRTAVDYSDEEGGQEQR